MRRSNYRDYLFFNRLTNNNESVDAFKEDEQFIINYRSSNFDSRYNNNRSDLSDKYGDCRS